MLFGRPDMVSHNYQRLLNRVSSIGPFTSAREAKVFKIVKCVPGAQQQRIPSIARELASPVAILVVQHTIARMAKETTTFNFQV